MAKKENAVNPELRAIGLSFYKGPFHFDSMGGYVWAKGDPSTNGTQMFADLDQASERCARIRGWGALSYLKDVDCEALQDEIGRMFAEAITEYWDRAKSTIEAVIPPYGFSCPKLVEIINVLNEQGISHVLTLESAPVPDLPIGDIPLGIVKRDLRIDSLGINTSLMEGDTVTLQQGRVFITRKPQN
jgi:hypothetical protein